MFKIPNTYFLSFGYITPSVANKLTLLVLFLILKSVIVYSFVLIDVILFL